jgi:hypothetical protein
MNSRKQSPGFSRIILSGIEILGKVVAGLEFYMGTPDRNRR